MTPADFRRRLHFRLSIILATSIVVVAMLGLLTHMIVGAFGSMAGAADAIDDARAIAATQSAIQAMKKQLAGTVRDNAYWDDAFRSINEAGGADWSIENWGTTTADYPLYDTSLVVEADGKFLMAYHKGEPLEAPHEFYGPSLKDMLVAARNANADRDVPVTFVKTKEGVALIGAAAIQPYVTDPKAEPARYKVLVFSKQLTTDVIAEVGVNFSIKGLRLEDAADPTLLVARLRDVGGKDVAYFNWASDRPGTESYDVVKPTILGAGVILVVLLCGIALVGLAAFRGVRREERVSHFRAMHDTLTGLWNRAGFLEQLGLLLGGPDAANVCMHMLDLDGFKPVNDAWGHAVGDELIRAVADRLVKELPEGAVVARLGGDEFAVISTQLSLAIPDDIQRALSTPYVIGGRTIEIGGSVGTAFAVGSINSTELMRRADLALYRAKETGRGMCVQYDASLDEAASKTAELEQDLRAGLKRGELTVAFQPLVDAATRAVNAVEALARWKSPTHGHIAPDVFIGVAEKAGLIDELGFYVLETAIREAARWPGIGVAVNISPLQLKNPYFVRQVAEVLRNAQFAASRLTIEVTEGVLISNPDQARRALEALKTIGVKIALDDFGCGYASIGALREFGFDRMKIDRSLVWALDHDEKAGAVLQATIALANALHLPVTAEGIETEEQAAVVRLSGCDELQGYLFSKPLSAEEITTRYFEQPAFGTATAG
jgi:diguanylate cyclase (GGDEF)-like protein